MTAGYIGNCHSRLHRFLNKGHLLLCGIPAPALNSGQDLDSISIHRHSRNTRRMPSSYLGDCVRFKWGLLHLYGDSEHAERRDDLRSHNASLNYIGGVWLAEGLPLWRAHGVHAVDCVIF